ncbi:hypothetical protein QM565_08415 [Geitlerinema splendidum]|nr:hypothetical protein [Geitlerinema splendidum]
MKILHHGLDQLQLPQKEEVNAFLKFIPPFPLDVSVAAYYIKSTHLTYEKYLKESLNTKRFYKCTRKYLKRNK